MPNIQIGFLLCWGAHWYFTPFVNELSFPRWLVWVIHKLYAILFVSMCAWMQGCAFGCDIGIHLHSSALCAPFTLLCDLLQSTENISINCFPRLRPWRYALCCLLKVLSLHYIYTVVQQESLLAILRQALPSFSSCRYPSFLAVCWRSGCLLSLPTTLLCVSVFNIWLFSLSSVFVLPLCCLFYIFDSSVL